MNEANKIFKVDADVIVQCALDVFDYVTIEESDDYCILVKLDVEKIHDSQCETLVNTLFELNNNGVKSTNYSFTIFIKNKRLYIHFYNYMAL